MVTELESLDTVAVKLAEIGSGPGGAACVEIAKKERLKTKIVKIPVLEINILFRFILLNYNRLSLHILI